MKIVAKIISLLLIIAMLMSINITAFAAETEMSDSAATEDVAKTIYNEVPLYNQKDYPNTPYGNHGTVSTHGCGIVCLAMVATYLHDHEYDIEELAKQFGSYNTKVGSKWILFEDSAKELGLDLREQTRSWKTARAALENGQVVISLQNENGYFTDGGHFIVLTGINEENLIMVNDPYGGNYNNWFLSKGFENGFEDKHITCGGSIYWIYGKKPPADYVKRKGYVETISQTQQIARSMQNLINERLFVAE